MEKILDIVKDNNNQLEIFYTIASDLVRGFPSLNQADIDAIDFKFTTNHISHAEKVVEYVRAHPQEGEAITKMFLETISKAVAFNTAMPGMNAIKKKLQGLAIGNSISIDRSVPGMQILFKEVISAKRELFREKDRILIWFRS
jgi:hypothetical protein